MWRSDWDDECRKVSLFELLSTTTIHQKFKKANLYCLTVTNVWCDAWTPLICNQMPLLFSNNSFELLQPHEWLLKYHITTGSLTALALSSNSSDGHGGVTADFAFFVRPFRILSTLSTMTASMPSWTCCCYANIVSFCLIRSFGEVD